MVQPVTDLTTAGDIAGRLLNPYPRKLLFYVTRKTCTANNDRRTRNHHIA